MALKNFQDTVNFIFGIADALRGPYKPNQYGKVVLPLTVLRRMDCRSTPWTSSTRRTWTSGRPSIAKSPATSGTLNGWTESLPARRR